MEKLDIVVNSGERARASDFNRTTKKVDELVDKSNQFEYQIHDLQEVVNNGGGGGGSSVIVDSRLDENSRNPVQNRVITQALTSALEGIEREKYTLAQYMELKQNDRIQNRFYTVYKNGELYRLYLGDTLIMKKAENGERVTVGGVFPLVFPIIFA